jgi:hypothetical protein
MANKIDAPQVLGKERTQVYVTIPEEDAMEAPYPAITINGTQYKSGKHFLDSELAGEIEDRMKRYNHSVVRLTQTKRDVKAEQLVSQFGSGRGQGAPVSPTSLGD